MIKGNNAYEEIGEYIIEFQKIPFILQWYIQIILNKYWLEKNFWNKDKNNIIARIILSERPVDHLLKMFLSLIKEYFWEKSNDFKITKKIIDFITINILHNRNDIIHSFLFVDENNINDIAICREKFKGKTWFGILENIPKNHLEEQISIIKKICTILHYIGKNFEENSKIEWNLKYWDISFNISMESIDNYIKEIKIPQP